MAQKSIPFIRGLDTKANSVVNESPQELNNIRIDKDGTLLKRNGLASLVSEHGGVPFATVDYITTNKNSLLAIGDGVLARYNQDTLEFDDVGDYTPTRVRKEISQSGPYTRLAYGSIAITDSYIHTRGFGQYTKQYIAGPPVRIEKSYSLQENSYRADSLEQTRDFNDKIGTTIWEQSTERDVSVGIYRFAADKYIINSPQLFTFSPPDPFEIQSNTYDIKDDLGNTINSFSIDSLGDAPTAFHAKDGFGAVVYHNNVDNSLRMSTFDITGVLNDISLYDPDPNPENPVAVIVTDTYIVIAQLRTNIPNSTDDVYTRRITHDLTTSDTGWILYNQYSTIPSAGSINLSLGANDSDFEVYLNTRAPNNVQATYALTNLAFYNGQWLGVFASSNNGLTGNSSGDTALSFPPNAEYSIYLAFYDGLKIKPLAILSQRQLLEEPTYLKWLKFSDIYIQNNEIYCPVFNDGVLEVKIVSQPKLYEFSDSINYIGNTVFFGANPSIYDGKNILDLPFRQTPKILSIGTIAGVLPAENVYYLATYFYKDNNGNDYESQLSPAFLFNNPLRYSTNVTVLNTSIGSFQELSFDPKTSYYIRLYKALNPGTGEPALTEYRLCGESLANSQIISTIVSDTTKLADITGNAQPSAASGIIMDPIPANNGGCFFDNSVFLIDSYADNVINFSNQYTIGRGLFFPAANSLVIEGNQTRNAEKITALKGMDSRLLIFKENSILQIYGSNGAYTEPETVSTEIGCAEPRSVITTGIGTYFKSKKGFYVITRAGETLYIGAGVEKYNNEIITGAVQIDNIHEIRFTTLLGRCLVYNVLYNEWTTFDNQQANSSCLWNGKYTLANGNNIRAEGNSFRDDGNFIQYSVDTGWLRAYGVSGFQRFKRLQVTGEYFGDHGIEIDSYHDYEKYKTHTYTFTPYATGYNRTDYPISVYTGQNDGVYRFELHVARQKGEAIRFLIKDTDTGATENSAKLASFDIIIDKKQGLYKAEAK